MSTVYSKEQRNPVSSRPRAWVRARAVPVLQVAADGQRVVETGFIDGVILRAVKR
jgi:hypothetical protein